MTNWPHDQQQSNTRLVAELEVAAGAGFVALLRHVQVRTTTNDEWRLAAGRIDIARAEDLSSSKQHNLKLARNRVEVVSAAELLQCLRSSLSGQPFLCGELQLDAGAFAELSNHYWFRSDESDYADGWPGHLLSHDLDLRFPQPKGVFIDPDSAQSWNSADDFIRDALGFPPPERRFPGAHDGRLRRVTLIIRDYRARIVDVKFGPNGRSVNVRLEGAALPQCFIDLSTQPPGSDWVPCASRCGSERINFTLNASTDYVRIRVIDDPDLVDMRLATDPSAPPLAYDCFEDVDPGLGVLQSAGRPKPSAASHQEGPSPCVAPTERIFMEQAVEIALRSTAEDERVHPRVGAVIVRDGQMLGQAYRGETGDGDHAEYGLTEKRLPNDSLVGATVYATLEPCTTRSHPKVPCVQRLIERKVARVVIGMLDPNKDIQGEGVQRLREANIEVQFFPQDLMAKIEEMNRDFTRQHRAKHGAAPRLPEVPGADHEDRAADSLETAAPYAFGGWIDIHPVAQLEGRNKQLVEPIVWQMQAQWAPTVAPTKRELEQAVQAAVVATDMRNFSRIARWPRSVIYGSRKNLGSGLLWPFEYKGEGINEAGDEQLYVDRRGVVAYQRDTLWDVDDSAVDLGLMTNDTWRFLLFAARLVSTFDPDVELALHLGLVRPASHPTIGAHFRGGIDPEHDCAAHLGARTAAGEVRVGLGALLSGPLALAAACKRLVDQVANEFEPEASAFEPKRPLLAVDVQSIIRMIR